MQPIRLLGASLAGWWNDRCLRMGAALSFYMTFSLAPVLLLAILMAGFAFGEEAVRAAIIGEFEGLVGAEPAAAVEQMLSKVGSFGSGFVSTATGAAIFFILATGAITELQDNLHEIWRVEPTSTPMRTMIRSRMLALAVVAVVGLLLMVSLVVSAGVTALTDRVGRDLQAVTWMIGGANVALSILAATALFAAIFKILPEFHIPWRDALVGSFLGAVLFQVGKFLIGFYLGRTHITSTYGAAGSLVTILLWIYYSSQILLFSAEFTKHYGEQRREGTARTSPDLRSRAR